MATTAGRLSEQEYRPDVLSGTPRAHVIDRWIYVFMAALFNVIVLTGFVPDSLRRIASVKAGQRPPFPLVAHVHAVLMGSFLLLLLAQTALVATGRSHLHQRLGQMAMLLAPALVIAGVILAPTNYHAAWNAAQSSSPVLRGAMAARFPGLDNILLGQIRIGILFSLFLAIGIRARGRDPGFHKRMMILATATTLTVAIDRITWLPTTFPGSPLASDLYILFAVAPLVTWDVFRKRSVHRAYWVWFPIYLAASVVVNMLWDTPWWHATARQIMHV